MKQNITEQLATKIAEDFMTTMNPDRWDGRKEKPDSVNTATYEDENKIKVNDQDCHIEIVIITDTETTWNHKPCLYVDLVVGSDSVEMAQSSTLSSTAIIAKMIMYVCNSSTYSKNKG